MAEAIADRLVDALHTETLVLLDEARAYFAGPGREDRDAMSARERVVFACESLKSTTRLMQLVAWLTSRRAGDGSEALDPAAESDVATLASLPTPARRLILAGVELHGRARRLADGDPEIAAISPARSLLERLERAF